MNMMHFDSINLQSVSLIAATWLCIFVLYLLNITLILRTNRRKMNKLHDRIAGIEQWLAAFYAFWKEE